MVWKKSFFVLGCCLTLTILSSVAFAVRKNPETAESAKNTSGVYNRFAEIIQKETGEEPIAVMARSSTLFIDIRKTLGSKAANNTLSIIQGLDQNIVKSIAEAKKAVQDVLYVVYNGQSEEVQNFTGYLIAHDSTIMSEVYKTYGVDISEDAFKLAGLVAMSPAMKRAMEKEINDKTTPAPGGGGSGNNGTEPRGGNSAVSGGGGSGGGGDAGTTFGNCLLNVALSKQKNGGPIMLFGGKGPGGGVGDPMTMPSDEGTRGAFPLRHSNTASGGGRSIAAVPCGMINISKTGGAVGKWSSEIKNVWSTAYDASYHLTRAENMLNKAEKLEKSGDSIDHAVAKQLKEKAKVELGKFGDAAKQNEQAVNAAIRANASADDIHNAQDSGQEAGEKDANDANDAGQANGNPDQPPETNHEAATPRWDDDSNSGGGAGNCGEAWEQCVGGNEGGGGSDNDCEGKFSNTLLGKKNDNSPILPSDDATSVGICGENGGGGIDAKFLFNSTGLGTYDPSPLDGPGSEPTGGGDPTPAPYSPYSPIKEMKQMLK